MVDVHLVDGRTVFRLNQRSHMRELIERTAGDGEQPRPIHGHVLWTRAEHDDWLLVLRSGQPGDFEIAARRIWTPFTVEYLRRATIAFVSPVPATEAAAFRTAMRPDPA